MAERVLTWFRQLSTLKKVLCCVALYRFVKFLRWRHSIVSKVPGPTPSILLGNIRSFVKAGGFNETFMKQLHDEHGPVAAFFIGPTICNFSVSDCDLIKSLYRQTSDRPMETYMFLNYLGDDNLMFSKGEQMRKLRSAYQVMLTDPANLRRLKDITFEEFRKIADKWASTKGEVDAFEDTGHVIYDILGRTLFNRRFLGTPEGDKIYKLHGYCIEHVNDFLILYSTPKWFRFLYRGVSRNYRKYLSVIEELRAECGKLLKERRAAINDGDFGEDKSALTFLCKDDLFRNDKHLAVTTMLGFLNGGFDTTHATIFWMLFFLAKYPAKAQKVYNEVQQELGKSGTPDMAALKKMTYVNAFVRESQRLIAIVPVNQRVNLAQDIEVDGYTIKKGTNVNIPNVVAFKDEKYFGPNTEDFIPERFIGQGEAAVKARKALQNFGGWTRVCAGIKFAENAELPSFLIAIVQNVTVHLVDPKQEAKYDIEAGVNQPFPKFNLRFERRKVFPSW